MQINKQPIKQLSIYNNNYNYRRRHVQALYMYDMICARSELLDEM